jgi:hypothetical protein
MRRSAKNLATSIGQDPHRRQFAMMAALLTGGDVVNVWRVAAAHRSTCLKATTTPILGLGLDAPPRRVRNVRHRTAKLKRETLAKGELFVHGQSVTATNQARTSSPRACCSSRSSPALERSPGRYSPPAAGGFSFRDQANRARRSITPRIIRHENE